MAQNVDDKVNPQLLISRLYKHTSGVQPPVTVNPDQNFNTRTGFTRPSKAKLNPSVTNFASSNGPPSPPKPEPQFFKPKPKVRVLPPGVFPVMAQGLELEQREQQRNLALSQLSTQPEIDEALAAEEMMMQYPDPSHNPFAFIQAVKSGSADFLEFVYLRPRVMGKGECSPYNLEVVPSSSVTRDDYYTLGLSGVTHFSNGKAEFTPLDRWQREYRLNGRLKRIAFFRKYRRWKAYITWHKQVRASKMKQASEDLSERLFILSPVLREALLKTRTMSQSISGNKLHRIAMDPVSKLPLQTYTLVDFVAEQNAQREEVEDILEIFSQDLVQVVAGACAYELDIFSKNNSTAGSSNPFDASSTSPKKGGKKVVESRANLTLASTTGGSSAGKMTYTEISTMRAECRKLTNFIRLCDYLVVDTLRELIWASTYDMLRFVTPQPSEMERVVKSIEDYERKQAEIAAKLERLRAIEAGEIEPTEEDEREEEERKKKKEPKSDAEIAEIHRLAEEKKKLAGGKPAAKADDDKKKKKGPVIVPLFVSELMLKKVHGVEQLVFQPLLGHDSSEVKTLGHDMKPQKTFVGAMNEVLNTFLDAVSSMGSLTQRDECKPFTAPAFNGRPPEAMMQDESKGMDMKHMMYDDSRYLELLEEIKERMASGFKTTIRYCNQFQPFREMYMTNAETDARSFICEDGDLSKFVDAIEKFNHQTQLITALQEDEKVGLLNVDTRQLKQLIAPAPTKCLKDIYSLLPQLAKESNQKLASDIERCTSFLTTKPKDVGEFVAYLSFLEKTSTRLDAIDQQYETVRDIYALIEESGIPITDQQQAEYRSTRPALDKIKSVVDEGEARRDEEIVKYNGDLNNSIEELKRKTTETKTQSFDPMLSSEKSDVQEALLFVNTLFDDLTLRVNESKMYTEWQMQFGLSAPAEYLELEETMADVSMKRKLWSSIDSFEVLTGQWEETPYKTLDAETTVMEIAKYGKVSYQVAKALQQNDAVPLLRDKVDVWSELSPTLQNLKNTALEAHHWNEITELLGVNLYQKINEENMTLKEMMATGLAKHAEKLELISVTATQERVLNNQLAKIQDTWEKTEFVPLDHKPEVYKEVYILGGIDDITMVLEDSQVGITTILGSRYVGRIRDKVEEWDRKLRRLGDTIEDWILCQRQWMYLEAIFASPDIQAKLPVEHKLFEVIDKQWKDTMRKVKENPVAIVVGTRPGLLEMFQKANENLDVIQKNLELYLEQKRLGFPRFYFLGDDDLLDILSQSKDPAAVQPHMTKMFDAMKEMIFAHDAEVTGLRSNEKEVVMLEKPFKARGEVEKWLVKVEENMRGTLFRDTKNAIKEFADQSLHEFIDEHSCMVVLTVMQIVWAANIEECLKADKPIKQLKLFYEERVKELEQMADITRMDLEKNQRTCLGAVITIFVHARDVVEIMIADQVTRVTDFGWLKQLRYQWDSNDGVSGDCFVCMTNARFRYGYEYLGVQPRLVITPLTDRVYITITGAIFLCLGAAPAGPAGTGKTESTKDLAKAMAFPCIVYNCSDGVTYLMVAKFFSGLVQTGSWACFDEFNRINIEVLSVIASQMLCICNGMRAKKDKFLFEGREVRLILTFGAIITMNPGYAGRTELPDNLKVLFRSVAVMVPDYQLIAEVILFSEGFYLAKKLSVKMRQLYKLASEQLSAQDHYDFGMRAVKSVLVMAGDLKRRNPDLTEDIVLLRAMVESNVPKFIEPDLPLFYGIVSDLFPGVSPPKPNYGEIGACLIQEIANRGLQPIQKFIGKIIEFYDVCIVRHGVALIGPTGGGKSQCRHIMSTILKDLRRKGTSNQICQMVHEFELNPKSIEMALLYGYANPITNEWTDGIVAATARVCIKPANPSSKTWEIDHKWILYDGPIDTLWIESMNSVLDDSKLLCLDSGERIKLNNTIHMIFEAMDLAVASPATVSRLGMVFLDPMSLGWRATFDTFLSIDAERGGLPVAMKAEHRIYLQELCAESLPKGFKFALGSCHMLVPSFEINLVRSFCDLFNSQVMYACRYDGDPAKETGVNWRGSDSEIRDQLLLCWAYAYIWGIGGNVATKDQPTFDIFFRENFKDVSFGSEGLVYEYYIDWEETNMKPYLNLVPSFTFNPETPFFSMLVPTVDTVRFAHLLDQSLYVNKPMLLNGTSGVGKSAMVLDCLTRCREKRGLVLAPLQFSAQTSAARTQEMITVRLEKKRKTTFGAPINKRIALFVDDMNMPKLEEFGAAPPIELLRQLVSQGGYYDREKLFFMDIQDVVLLGACGEPGGGKNHITPRFLRYFHLLCVPETSTASMTMMFSAILGGFLTVLNFPEVVQKLAGGMVQATIQLFKAVIIDLLPTPARCHYTFNLRDVSKVFQGILRVKVRACQREDTMTKLWAHECARCFHDRLINKDDKEWFYAKMGDLLKNNMSSNLDPHTIFRDKPLMFGDYMKGLGTPAEDRMYEEIADKKKLTKVLTDFLDDFNLNTSKPMPLVLFMDCIDHVNRVARVLRQKRGNALLVGVGGSGKQSVVRLSSAVADAVCTNIELKRGYNGDNFKEDIKNMFFTAGLTGNSVAFMFTDSQIVEEGFVEDINNILNSGEVPNLFELEDKMKIVDGIRNYMKEINEEETPDNCYKQFILRVRDNLHICLCFSPVGEAFRQRCKMFPSLVNCCTIDWFNEWPKEALYSVAKITMDELDVGKDEYREPLINMCVDIHAGVFEESELFWSQLRRKNYVTPTSYLEFIKLYQMNLDDKRGQVARQRDKLANGLRKLAESEAVVADLQAKITLLQPVLTQKTKEAEEILIVVSTETEKANVVRVKVGADEKVVGKQAEEANIIAKDAQADLDKALPAMNAAVKALDSLNKGDIGEMKGYKTPPDAVVKVLNAVLLLFGFPKKKQNWDEAKTLMTDSNFLTRCRGYDKDNIEPKMLNDLKVFIDDEEFDPDYVRGKSVAASSLCMWVRAVDIYAKVAKDVEPKKQMLAAAKAGLAAAQSSLKEKQDSLAAVEQKLKDLEEKQNFTLGEKKRLQDESDLCTGRLLRAGKLTDALASEKVRWTENVVKLNAQINECVGSVFLAAAFIGYLSPFDSTFRDKISSAWVEKCATYGIPVSNKFSLYEIMADPVQVRQWHLDGLPYDGLSVENGIVVKVSRRWPMMIDPQGQARFWIGRMEKKDLKVMKPTTPNYLRLVETCIRNGNALVLEDAWETIDPALEPVLLKQVYKQQGRLLLRLGDGDIDYDPNFKFYITTKLPNPHYAPELCIKVTVVNFMVTFLGLEDQLLAEVVMLERPDLEDAKNDLIKSMAADKKQITELEDKILTMLKEAEGNILDNVVLIDTLEQSKKTSNVIAAHLEEAEVTNQRIMEARLGYTIVATRGSILYFVVADLSKINDMYQFSLDFFKSLFRNQIELSQKDPDVLVRCTTLITNITSAVYATVCRGLFEQDKLILSFLFCCNIMKKEGKILDDEWTFFVRGSGLAKKEGQPPNPDDTWLSEPVWDLLDAGDRNVASLSGLCASLDENMFAWKTYILSSEPHQEQLPGDWGDRISHFAKLLILKSCRPEKMMYVAMDFVKDEMGPFFIEPIAIDLKKIYPETTCKFPVIFIFSTGCDPTEMLMKFVREEMGYGSERMHIVSLGQGQGPKALKAIKDSETTGDFAFLQNCHLASTFMPQLEAVIESWSADGSKVSPDFRLWLSTMPCGHFPISVLQNGIKITTEAPKGLRANMLRSIFNLTDKFMESTSKTAAFKKLVFGCVFFHAIIQERKKFGPVGWNIKYEFNDSDLETSLEMVKMYLEEAPGGTVPWETVNYMLSEISYGGRVTDDKDRRLIASILKTYYNEKVLSDEYKFSSSGIYFAPPNSKRADYLTFVENFPYQDDPDAFGMHENANISSQMQESGYMMDTVMSVLPRSSGGGGGGKSSDDIVSEMNVELLEKLPTDMSISEDEGTGQFDILESGLMDSMATVVSHEMNRFNKLLKTIRRVLLELTKALKGLVVMSDELDGVYACFLSNAVPKPWVKAAYPSLKPLGSWVKDLYARIDFIRAWVRTGAPAAFWISGFYFPQGFMTGMLQNNSRKYQIPIDTLGVNFTVTKAGHEDITEPAEDGMFCWGMYMDGARLDWETTKVEDSHPGVMYTQLPVIKFNPVANFVRNKNDYACPLYKTSTRAGALSTTGHSTNFVVMLDLPTDKDIDYWVLKGAAALTQLND